MRRFVSASAAVAVAVVLPALADQSRLPMLQHLPPGRELHPSRAASFSIVDGRMLLTSDWIPLSGTTTRNSFIAAAFDAAEHSVANGVFGAPTDNQPGCSAEIPTGDRWFFGSAFNNPYIAADIATGPEGAGAACSGVTISWYIEMGPSEPDSGGDGFPDSGFYIGISTFEAMDVVNCTDPGSSFIDGVVYNFTGVGDPHPGHLYSNITLDGTGLFHTMPADGLGGYQLVFASAYDEATGRLTVPQGIDFVTGRGVNVQAMLWGTGNHEPIHDGRIGLNLEGQFDDGFYSAPDGTLDWSDCVSYSFSGVCPSPLAAAVGFWFKDQDDCPCDLNDDDVVDVSDLATLLGHFGSNVGEPGDIDGDRDVDLLDLSLILACFGTTCP